MKQNNRIILAITGASGVLYGLRALQALKALHYEVHLIISPTGEQVIAQETQYRLDEVIALADRFYPPDDLSARIASGSFETQGMLIVPCSIKTLSGVAHAYADNLIQRAADVCLKEGRPLVLAVRETPLHSGHLRLMSEADSAGAILFPLSPTFYNQPKTIDDLVNTTVGRMLSRIGIENQLYQPWDNHKLAI